MAILQHPRKSEFAHRQEARHQTYVLKATKRGVAVRKQQFRAAHELESTASVDKYNKARDVVARAAFLGRFD